MYVYLYIYIHVYDMIYMYTVHTMIQYSTKLLIIIEAETRIFAVFQSSARALLDSSSTLGLGEILRWLASSVQDGWSQTQRGPCLGQQDFRFEGWDNPWSSQGGNLGRLSW